jgi:hypothetical protein
LADTRLVDTVDESSLQVAVRKAYVDLEEAFTGWNGAECVGGVMKISGL